MQAPYGAVAYDIPNSARHLPGVLVNDDRTDEGNLRTDFCARPGMPNPEYELGIVEKVVLDDVYDEYGKLSAHNLGNLTKQSQPWLKADAEGVKTLDLMVAAPTDPRSHAREVLARIDRSARGTPDQIAERNIEVDGFMRPLRQAALGER
jgi:hypothetical protein